MSGAPVFTVGEPAVIDAQSACCEAAFENDMCNEGYGKISNREEKKREEKVREKIPFSSSVELC